MSSEMKTASIYLAGGCCHVPLDMIRWAKTADPAEYLAD